jgi:hypothetical protein
MSFRAIGSLGRQRTKGSLPTVLSLHLKRPALRLTPIPLQGFAFGTQIA